MRKKLAGLVLASSLLVGVGPLASAAHANTNPPPDTTDPVLCFVAANTIITQALTEYRAHTLTAAQLRAVLVGTSAFLGDCLTP